jgi:hypothetical protein
MVWKKTKIVTVTTTIVALGTMAVVVMVSFFPSIKGSYFQLDYGQFQKIPDHLFVIRATHFHNPC